MDQSREIDEPRGPEESSMLMLTCPRCGTRLSVASEAPLGHEPSRETVTCPSCGFDMRLGIDPTLA